MWMVAHLSLVQQTANSSSLYLFYNCLLLRLLVLLTPTISVYEKMKATYKSLCDAHTSHGKNLDTVIDTTTDPVLFEDWCRFYKDGVKFIMEYNLLFPRLTPKQALKDCIHILKTDIKRQVDLK